MSKILKNEICRSYNNEFFLVSVLMGTVIVIWFAIGSLPWCIERNNEFSTEIFPMEFIETSYLHWIGTGDSYVQNYIFYLILPFLAVLPFAGSLFSDMKHGYIKGICTRTNKKHYLLSKYIAVFLSGGSVTAICLLISFLIAAAFLPSMLPESSFIFTNIFSSDKWAGVLFTHPMLYVLIYVFLSFIVSGLLACTSLAISFVSDKSFLPLVFPFFLYVFSSLFCELFDAEQYSMMSFLKAQGTSGTTFSVLLVVLILFIISFFPYYVIGVRKDVY